MEEDRYLFLAADVNGDDKLNAKEFLSFSHPEEDQSMRPHVLTQVMLTHTGEHTSQTKWVFEGAE